MAFSVEIHTAYTQPGASPSPAMLVRLAGRKSQLLAYTRNAPGNPVLSIEENEWLARSYPVLAILAPVMSTSEEKIEFPGDPMCLYSALSYAVFQATETRRQGWDDRAPYNDLCPQWGYTPSDEYRQTVDDNGIRSYEGDLLNTDQTVFDPRVWNPRVAQFFEQRLLAKIQPRVVLISSVSPGHRYALEIARAVRKCLPDCLIVLGGRHTDETMHFDPISGSLKLEPTSTLRLIEDGKIERLVDFVVSGQGYYALDLLLKAISLAMDVQTRQVKVADVIRALDEYAPLLNNIAGQSVLTAVTGDDLFHTWPLLGPKLVLETLPSPYRAFAIRARFPIFLTNERVSRTAHFMVTTACPYHCFFCSEGVTVVGSFISFTDPGIEEAIARMVEYVSYGAEAIFFDDSVFWGGNVPRIILFCREWIRLRDMAKQAAGDTLGLFGYTVQANALLQLQWGAQFTADVLASRANPNETYLMLSTMYQAGCTYLYMGIESMAEDVIGRVHKNVNRKEPWETRVRRALGLVRQSGLRIGSSVLFGLEGETRETIKETISKVEELVAEDLVMIASPNILTYHPNTEITRLHEMQDKLDYHNPNIDNRPPYVYFEEAFPAVVSRNLTEEDIWYIHQQTGERWGKKRNTNPMPDVILPDS